MSVMYLPPGRPNNSIASMQILSQYGMSFRYSDVTLTEWVYSGSFKILCLVIIFFLVDVDQKNQIYQAVLPTYQIV
jgi:hypothetical protein